MVSINQRNSLKIANQLLKNAVFYLEKKKEMHRYRMADSVLVEKDLPVLYYYYLVINYKLNIYISSCHKRTFQIMGSHLSTLFCNN